MRIQRTQYFGEKSASAIIPARAVAFLGAIFCIVLACAGNAAAQYAQPGRLRAAGGDRYWSPGVPAQQRAQTVAPQVQTPDVATVRPSSVGSASATGSVRIRTDQSSVAPSRQNGVSAAPQNAQPETTRTVRQTAPVRQNTAPNQLERSGERPVQRQTAPVAAPAQAEQKPVAPVALPGQYLAVRNGQYDFLKIVPEEELEDFVARANGLCVVIPHRNFIFETKEEKTGQDGDETSGEGAGEQKSDPVGFAVSNSQGGIDASVRPEMKFVPSPEPEKLEPPLPDDYVVFLLTNLEEDEKSLLKDSRNGRWDDVDLLNAALIAEGLATKEKRARYCSRFGSLLSLLSQQTDGLQDQLMKTEKVYSFLHSRALYSRYNLNCSSVAASLDSGVFNCVSATVLFNCFASRVGLDVAALETTGHAKSRVKYADSYLDIETTCTDWNRLPDQMRPYARSQTALAQGQGTDGQPENNGVDSQATPRPSLDLVSYRQENPGAELGSTSFTINDEAPLGYSFTRSRRPMREISDVELVATIYYNVGVDFYQNGEYERAIASYVKAVQLAPENKTILGNLKATLNNWAIDVAMKEKKYETAIRITDLGQSLDPDFNEFKMNMPIFFHDWIEYLAKDGKWDEINLVKEKFWQRFPQYRPAQRQQNQPQ